MIKKTLMLIFLSGVICLPVLRAGNEVKKSKFESRRYNNHSIVVRQTRPHVDHIGGRLPSEDVVKRAAERFFAVLDQLPANFIKRSGLKYVTFLNDLTLNNVPAGGIARADSIFLNVNFSDKTVYHELFHIFDPRPKDRKWTRLNNKKFVYTGSDFYAEKVSSVKRKRKAKNLQDGTFDDDFVSRYAMSNEKEDRAETFAFMISEKQGFLRRTAKSPVLRKKMEFIVRITSKNNLLGSQFWQNIFKNDSAGQ
ncbi:MAG: hypothetical protein E7042_07445 [Lentisphaerae bacterium]|nr:hypothetical protein [Lentisphaerota bacterium]